MAEEEEEEEVVGSSSSAILDLPEPLLLHILSFLKDAQGGAGVREAEGGGEGDEVGALAER
uniref:Uncharacterized protein n=1 Tax=Oryza punctata TaxID=4537 RepID=A0A0E0L806_ORYPU